MYANPASGLPEHPHPMFRTWGEQVEWFVNKHMPGIGNYRGIDLDGVVFCGRVSPDKTLPSGIVTLNLSREV